MKLLNFSIFLMCVSVVLSPLAFSQNSISKVIKIEDEGSANYGKTVITDYDGPVHSKANGSRAISQMPGWPIVVGNHPTFSPSRGLIIADLDQDGRKEIIVSATDKNIYVWDFNGVPLPGFPVSTIQFPQYAPTVVDLDNDGDMEIVQFTRGITSGGRFYIIDHKGANLMGFPVSVNNGNLAGAPTCYDLDNDGVLEILVPERDYPIGKLHVFEIDGTEWGGMWPATLDHVPTGSPAIGDVDNDGDVEIVYMSYNSLYLFNTDGSIELGWPVQVGNLNFSYQSAALADLDNDNDLEIVVGGHKNAAGCYVFDHSGTPYAGWPKLLNTWTYCAPTVVDLEGDGELDILDGRAGYMSGSSDAFWAWNHAGNLKSGFPYVSSHGGGCDGPLTVADIDGDGDMEIFTDHNIMNTGQGFLFGVDHLGNDLPDFPLRPDGFTYMNGAAIADVDGDGDFELGVLSSYDTDLHVNLYDLQDKYNSPKDANWPTYHKLNSRGGLYGSEPKLNLMGYFAINNSSTIYLHDQPGFKACLWASVDNSKLYSKKLGWFFISFTPPFPLMLLSNVLIPASGEVDFEVKLPNNPTLIGLPFYIQGITGPDPYKKDGKTTNLLNVVIH